MDGAAATVETPSGKWSGDENFPVGSWLLAARLRPHVAAFYALARTTDDIADNPDLAPDEKLRRLNGFLDALQSDGAADPAYATAARARDSMAACGVTTHHLADLIDAFKQDATRGRYADWYDLMGYCNRSAAPVGRFLLDLHGEDPAHWIASDALCNALQVLNHLQDCKDDYLALDRVYLPHDRMAAHGAVLADLAADRANPALRHVLDDALAGVDDLMVRARMLPGRLQSRRLAMESAVIVRLADRLTALLRAGDPIAGRVALRKSDFAACGVRGILAGLTA
jgi:squalene synthase HpnC